MARKKRSTWIISRDINGLILLSVGILTLISLFSDKMGILGEILNAFARCALGHGAIIIPIITLYMGIVALRKGRKKGRILFENLLGAILLSVIILSTLHLHYPISDMWEWGWAGEGGGIIGAILAYILLNVFGPIGSYVILITIGLVGFVLLTKRSLAGIVESFVKKLSQLREHIKKTSSRQNKIYLKDERPIEKAPEELPPISAIPINMAVNNSPGSKPLLDVTKGEPSLLLPPSPFSNLSYQLPPLNLLRHSPQQSDPRWQKTITDNIRLLEQVLNDFAIKAKIIGASRGPAITRYELQLAPGTKVSRIMSLSDDISLHLATANVRIEAPIPGKAAVGIEVPNREILPVFLRDIVANISSQNKLAKLTFALGKNITGKSEVADLSKMPHLLIAGATGSGKSVYLNCLLASLLFRVKPDEVKFLLIDPKRVELNLYNDLPHLLAPVVVEPQQAAASLCWLVQEMENRYNLFAQKGVRDLDSYNRSLSKEDQEELFLPYIVVIIDELADLMLVAPNEVEDSICRLAQMARAAGIHLVIATQRPSVDVITGLIKANIPSRISFAVSSQVDSRTILDTGGAEKLLGKGDMLFLPVGVHKPFRIQGAYITDKEVEKLVAFWRQQAEPEYREEVLELDIITNKGENKEEVVDELYHKALSVVVDHQQASTSMLQRRLRIGYTRAARLIDSLEEKGYIGPPEGSKPRQVFITKEHLQRLIMDNEV